MSRLALFLSIAALAAAGLPAAAPAATWSTTQAACYVSVGSAPQQRQVVPVEAQGFTPNSPVDILLDGAPADATDDGVADPFYADAAGLVKAGVRAPYQPGGQRPFTLSVTDRGNPANTVSVTTKVTALGVELRPAQAAPSRRVRFLGSGFVRRASVWAHYLFRGKVRATVRLAKRSTAPCGTFSVRRKQIPVVRPHTGRWTLQIDQQKTYSPAPDTVFVRLEITVQRVIRSG
jgi:hypothetical protein